MPTCNNTAPAVAQSAPVDLPRPLADAIAEQQLRTWRLAETLRALGENREDEGVSAHAVLLVADAAEGIADALDSVNLPPQSASPLPDAPLDVQRTIAEAGGEGFDELLRRMLDIVSHLQCADRILYDLESVPQDLQPASIVVHSATEALDRLHNALSEWDAAHDCQALSGGAA